MIKWENYITKSFMLNTSTEPTNFIRSQFDYGVRQRRALRSYPKYVGSVYLEWYDIADFKQFWTDTNEGTDIFNTDMLIHGDDTSNKEIRATAGYSMQELGCGRYKISFPIELVKTGTLTECPLAPRNLLIIGQPLVPCG